MYKLSVPVGIPTLRDDVLPAFVEIFRAAKVERVFLCGLLPLFKKSCYIYENAERMAYLIKYFREEGFEVGVWESAFGHGAPLAHDKKTDYADTFTSIVGADGETCEAFCPLDEKFRNMYYTCIRKIAAMHPDIIMLDDDFRLNTRKYTMGCCCEAHLERFYAKIGTKIPREKMEVSVFSGGENRYRSAWMQVMGESLTDFARLLRRAVDTVDPAIRLGCCMCYDTWDFDGTDGIALARAFAGNTKPFLRTIGAPYHNLKLQSAVEYTRMQAAWCKDADIEVFAEGDVYPRPRYVVPSKLLEVFDMALLATGETDGILKYMFDYTHDVTYETGYTQRHVCNNDLRNGIKVFFENKKNIGVWVYEVMHKTEKFVLPNTCEAGTAKFVAKSYASPALEFLSENAIPTVYEGGGAYPVIVFGENARYIAPEDLKNGAILDAVAAQILAERGIDTGLRQSEKKQYEGERFTAEEDTILLYPIIETQRVVCAPNVRVLTTFLPEQTPASYLYENKDGYRFYVLAADAYRSEKSYADYFKNYHRQKHLINAIAWMCGRPLPAVCPKNPFLYIQTAQDADGTTLSVALYNINLDDIQAPEITLDKTYKTVNFLNCDGELCGNKVRLFADIPPYGVAIFEVR